MYSKYTLELEIVVDRGAEERVIQTARRVYSEHGPVKERSDEAERQISAEEFIDGLQDALLELVEYNPNLRDAGVEIRALRCSVGEPIRVA